MIDTAAKVTVISEELYQRLKFLIEHVNLIEVTGKNMISAKLLKSVVINDWPQTISMEYICSQHCR